MLEPVEKVFGEKLYMLCQFKINGKKVFESDVQQCHQDYGTWINNDMMPEPKVMNVAIFLDDANQYNGPMKFIPGSHKHGVLKVGHDLTTQAIPCERLTIN